MQMPAGEVYNSLQTGLIDGLVTGASAVNDFKLDEVANVYSVGAPLGHIMFYLAMNQNAYDGLSDELKKAVDDNSGKVLSRSGEQGWNARANETLKRIREESDNKVIELNDDEIAKFEKIADAFRKQRLAEKGMENVLDAMRGE